MFTAGVPVFRLPRELVMAEINAILSLGVEIEMQSSVSAAISASPSCARRDSKRSSWASACRKAASSDLPGAKLSGVYDGMDFLRAFNEGKPMPVGKTHHRDRRRQCRL